MTPEIEAQTSVARQRELFRSWLRGKVGDAPVRFVETHVSILGMSVDRVWKLKKAVRFPFIDLSTVALRRANAEREVALNRRFAPDVYLGVVPLDDIHPSDCDVVVEMRRMPDERRLSVVAAAAPERAAACIERIAAALARIHRDAPSGADIDLTGAPEAVLELWDRSLGEMRDFAPAVLDRDELEEVAADVGLYAAGRAELFRRRIDAGRVRDGHGDLLADDVFCLDAGPVFLDCLEFDDRLRYGDVLADVAFLAMDLERLGHRALATALLDAYRRCSDDWWPSSLADFYVAYRAVVRSKIACLRVGSNDADAAPTARALLALAHEHLARGRVRLVLIGGPPATGKTTLARALAARTGWSVVRSDEVRKNLAGLEPTTSAADDLDAGLYAPSWTAQTYDALLDAARTRLASGESVILDASWSDAALRDDATRLAQSATGAFSAFLLSVPEEVADARAQVREHLHADASDASTRVTRPLRARFTPWADAIELDATGPPDALAASVLDHVGYPDR